MSRAPERKRTRLDAFTDAAFAFALTLLAIGGDKAPASIEELRVSLTFIPAFLASAAILLMFWYSHMRWSRSLNTGLAGAVWLSMTLVCVVLIFVYPLRLVNGSFFHWLSGGFLQAGFALTSVRELIFLFVVYATGFGAMCLCVVGLYAHSLRHADVLNLSAEQRVEARFILRLFLLMAAPAGVAVAWALWAPRPLQAFALFAFSVLAVLMPWHAQNAKRRFADCVAQEKQRMANAGLP